MSVYNSVTDGDFSYNIGFCGSEIEWKCYNNKLRKLKNYLNNYQILSHSLMNFAIPDSFYSF